MDTDKNSMEYLVRGVLAKIGDVVDHRLGREPAASQMLAMSELSDRLRDLLDQQARTIPGKGKVAPHNICLKLQWDKFSDESPELIESLESELTIAAIDHINDSLYQTNQPLKVKATRDYFTQGANLTADFDDDSTGDTPSAELLFPSTVGESVSGTEEDSDEERSETTGPGRVLVLSIGEDEQREMVLRDNGRFSIGRSASNELTIDDASISKIHATLAFERDGSICIADTGSTNGTFINGERIAYGTSVPISSGDTLTLGSVDVRLAIRDSPDEASS